MSGRVPSFNQRRCAEALRAARSAFPDWAATPAPTRGQVIGNMGRLLMEHKEDLVRLQAREIGKTLKECGGKFRKQLTHVFLPIRGAQTLWSDSQLRVTEQRIVHLP
ncbi:MAG: hypothetical protein Ct9H90mP14_1840 [Methanobacteriota archaeon]|nr:MAG: hypothetical protein Ct9H90mP14_1840 [Euryarchaeota archaeon]